MSEIPVLKCWWCRGGRDDDRCVHCGKTGSIFFVSGITFPYTPRGELQAEAMARKLKQERGE